MNRRNILKSIALSGLAPLSTGYELNSKKIKAGYLTEPERQTPVVQETDVIVCGGGPAGIAAAISAARSGARTTLIELYGCLGGIWTTGRLSYIIDYETKPGIMQELVKTLNSYDAQHRAKIYDAELMKLVLDKMCKDAGVNVRLYTRVTGAYTGSNNKLEYITTESFSGREAWKAKTFIDTTGNGDVAALAGCDFSIGHPKTGKTQPMSLMAILTGLDENEVSEAGYMSARGGNPTGDQKNWFYNEIAKAGVEASYTKPTLFSIRPGLVCMMANHQYGVSGINSDEMTNATIEARAEVNRIVDGLRSIGGLWRNLRIVATGSQIGIREARRIHGHYMITADDLIKGAEFNDAVCKVSFGVDVHSLERKDGGGYGSEGVRSKPYDIPLRSLIAKDVNGLMMAGRCISGDFFAHASYRVTGNAVSMGEAAGKVAAYAALNGLNPHKVPYKDAI